MLPINRQVRPIGRVRKIRAGRAQAACVNCKERKLKCDDQVPACANCRRFGITCLVEDAGSKRHLPRNYLESLEERVEVLGRQLRQQSGSRAIEAQPSIPRSQDLDIPESSTSSVPNHGNTPTYLVSQAGVLSLNASGAEPQYFGPSSMFSFSRIIHACVRQVGANDLQRGQESSLGEMQGITTTACRLPSYEIGVALGNTYFENVHLQYPFLHEPTFRKWEKNALGQGSREATPNELFFVHMVYATSALLKPNSGSLPGQLYTGALQYIDHVLARKNLESIQAVLSCAMYSLRASTGPSIWNLSGLALRQCIELGYHRDVKKINLSSSVLKLELRKRAFWCAYQMDCVSSINLGLPLGLPIHEIDTELPLDVNDSCLSELGVQGLPRQSSSDPVTTTSHALHQFRLRCLWARIYQLLYPNSSAGNSDDEDYQAQVRMLRAELDDWIASTPPEPRRSSPSLTVFASLENYRVDYSETILLLYRSHLTTEHAINTEVYQECMQAATNICQSCKRLYLGKPINYTWSTLHVLFQAGLTYLHCLWAAPSIRQNVRYDSVSSIFTTCIMLLTIMAERWDGAAPYRDLFEALSSRALAMMIEQNRGAEQPALPTPSDLASQSHNPNMEDLAQWASDIADVGMPDTFDTLLCGLIGDFFGSEAQAFYNDSNEF